MEVKVTVLIHRENIEIDREECRHERPRQLFYPLNTRRTQEVDMSYKQDRQYCKQYECSVSFSYLLRLHSLPLGIRYTGASGILACFFFRSSNNSNYLNVDNQRDDLYHCIWEVDLTYLLASLFLHLLHHIDLLRVGLQNLVLF
jgi:hypothetical protein